MNYKQVIKFIITTIIFYLLLVYNVFHIGEKLLPTAKDYLQSDTQQETTWNQLQQITWHTSANDDLTALCETSTICDKISFNGKYTIVNKYFYTKTIADIVAFIDNNSTQDKKIEDTITNITINNQNGTRRWYATRDSIVLNLWSVQSKKEFAELSTHEMGHITDLWYIQWTSWQKDKNFTEFDKVVFSVDDISLSFYKFSWKKETIRKSEAKKKDFCSWYGMSDPFEDFAECFNLYTNHNSFFRKIAENNSTLKKKYNYIAAIVDGEYISKNSQDISLLENNITRRPRDTTKLTSN